MEALKSALNEHTATAWNNFAADLKAQQDADVRMALALAGLVACEDEDLGFIVATARAGEPVPPLLDAVSEARDWARFASGEELEAYAASAFLQMHPKRQRRFRSWAKEAQHG